MSKLTFFFKKKGFTDIRQPCYDYLGYYIETDSKVKRYPLTLYFGNNEISIYYTNQTGLTNKVFSLYAAAGDLNQNMFSDKIENYALMPLWPHNIWITPDIKNRNLYVESTHLENSFFAVYFGFEFKYNCFSYLTIPSTKKKIIKIKDGGAIKFIYQRPRLPLATSITGEVDGETGKDTWKIENGKIQATKINFAKVLLDFLFELEYADTFEDRNFFAIQPALQNNLLLDGLTKKCAYLVELLKLRNFSRKKAHQELPKPFLEAEKKWINVCVMDQYRPVFESPRSLFENPETEVKNLLFQTRIGQGRIKRITYLNKTRTENSDLYKNKLSAFFMKKYNILSAFRVMLPDWAIPLFPLLLLFIPLGDFLIYLINNKDHTVKAFFPLYGFSSVLIPVLLFCFIILWYGIKKINLFKLFMPRLFLGIMMGWSLFWTAEELWKKAFRGDMVMTLIFNGILLAIIFLYIFTDISNQIIRNSHKQILLKTGLLMGVSLLFSFVIGFYVIQFFAAPILENSDFLNNPILYEYNETNDKEISTITEKHRKLDDFFEQKKPEVKNKILSVYIGNYKIIENYHAIPLFKNDDYKIRYLWSVLLSQIVISVLLGIVLQMLWEDRPITEPL